MWSPFMQDHTIKISNEDIANNDYEKWIYNLFDNGQYSKAKKLLKIYENLFLNNDDISIVYYQNGGIYLCDYNNYIKFENRIRKFYFENEGGK